MRNERRRWYDVQEVDHNARHVVIAVRIAPLFERRVRQSSALEVSR